MTKIPVAKPFIDQKDIDGVVVVLKSGILGLGPRAVEFEKNFAAYIGTKYACAVSSGTAGLHLCVKALGLKDGDEVITTPFSFIASSNCLLYERVKPVFVDIEEETFNIDPSKIEKAITPKTKAILVVHIFGQAAKMEEILKIARKYKLKVIEDSCESIGSTYKGVKTGSFGVAGVFAFYPNKQMTTGEGGIITTDDKKIYDLVMSLRNQGRGIKNDWLDHERLGYNYRMDDMSASLGATQLKKLDWMIEQKSKIANLYNKYLSGESNIVIPTATKENFSSWFVYVIRIKNGKRDFIMKKLAEKEIYTKPYLPVIHLQPFMKKVFGYKKGDFPIAEKVSSETLALPFYIGLKEAEIKKVCNEIKKLI